MSDGLADSTSNKVYLDTPYVSVRWDGVGNWMFVEWKAWANSTEYRAALETVLLALRESRATRNLIDATHAGVVADDDQVWLIENWIPRAAAAGRRWTAIVMPKSALGRTISENIGRREKPNARTEARYFETVEDAAAWLSSVN
ncbi:MAG TPA: hypothetical protein VIO34_04875 [Candidatus Dormibacteraeota bacterium]